MITFVWIGDLGCCRIVELGLSIPAAAAAAHKKFRKQWPSEPIYEFLYLTIYLSTQGTQIMGGLKYHMIWMVHTPQHRRHWTNLIFHH